MSTAVSILTGLLSGMNGSGATNHLARLLAQKVGHYDPYKDPLFYGDLQRAAQLGEAAKSNFIKQYDSYMRYNIPQGAVGPVRMSDEQKWNQITGTMYSTPMFSVRDTMQQYDPTGDYSWLPNTNVPLSQFKDIMGHNLLTANSDLALQNVKIGVEDAQQKYWNNYATLRNNEAQNEYTKGQYFADNRVDAGQVAKAYGLPWAHIYEGMMLSPTELHDFLNAIGVLDKERDKIGMEAYAAEQLGESRKADASYTNAITNPTVEKLKGEAYEALKHGDLYGAQANQTNQLTMPMIEEIKSRIYENTMHGDLYGAQKNTEFGLLPYKQAEYNSQIGANNALRDNRLANTQMLLSGQNLKDLVPVFQNVDGTIVYKNKAGMFVNEYGLPVTDANGDPMWFDGSGNAVPLQGLQGINLNLPKKAPVVTKQYNAPIGPATPPAVNKQNTLNKYDSPVGPFPPKSSPKYDVNGIINVLLRDSGAKTNLQLVNILKDLPQDKKNAIYNQYGMTVIDLIKVLLERK